MSESVIINKFFVGGILVEVHSHCTSVDSHLPVHALFLLHGRTLSTASVTPIAKSVLELTYGLAGASRKRDLIIIAYDHRNHGTRLIDPQRNQGWHKDPAKNNPHHAIDMYTIQTGTAHDITLLIDYIPAYLYPQVERNIAEWGVAGISLGGHSTWIALTREPRLQLAIPIIGCPDFTKLMSQRAEHSGVPFEAPYYPLHLKAHVDAYDPASFAYRENDVTNPFLGKRILVLSGAKDRLVPWSTCQEFVEGLEVGDGVKKVMIEDNAGHECTPSMIREAALFLTDWLAK